MAFSSGSLHHQRCPSYDLCYKFFSFTFVICLPGAAELESDADSDDDEDQSGSEDESDAASESGESSEEDGAGPSFRGLPIEKTVTGSQRSRRKAVFSTEPVQAADGESLGEKEAGQDSDEDEEEQIQARLQSSSSAGSSGRDSDADSQDSEGRQTS